jgi:hypothetical protein
MLREAGAETQTRDGEDLARAILKRLDEGEALSRVIPSVRRLAEISGNLAATFWLEIEDVGLQGIDKGPKGERRPRHEEDGLLRFMKLHGTEAVDLSVEHIDRELERGLQRTEVPKRDMVVYHSIAELERSKPPMELEGADRYDRTMTNAYGRILVFHAAAQRILTRVRSEVYAYVSRTETSARQVRRLIELFGVDAVAVFAAGGALLGELINAAASLERPGMAATAAMQARTALLTMGRELKNAGGTHVSPTGTQHDLQQEMNRLHARLDELHAANDDPAVQKRLEDAHDAANAAYRLGSRGKNPAAVTHDQASEATRAVYAVAHAICFAGGFPPPAAQTTPSPR